MFFDLPWQKANTIRNQIFTDQIAIAIFKWLRTIVTRDDIIQIDYFGHTTCVQYSFPLYPHLEPDEIECAPNEATFSIKMPGGAVQEAVAGWKCIFKTAEIELWEKESRPHPLRPLRFGFSNEELRQLLTVARDSLRHYLSTKSELDKKYFLPFSQRFHVSCGVGVALWTEGKLRGSQVVENMSLVKGVAQAAIFASEDPRFEATTEADLAHMRIEITILVGPRLPYPFEDILMSQPVDPSYGYRLKSGDAIGWLFPEIFNIKSLASAGQFFEFLAKEKAGLQDEWKHAATVDAFPVVDCIEDSTHTRPLVLNGPIVDSEGIAGAFSMPESAHAAAEWLVASQQSDGGWPLYLDPLTGQEGRNDPVRIALTAYALAQFGAATSAVEFSDAARKAYAYVTKIIQKKGEPPRESSEVLTLVYAAKTAFALSLERDYRELSERVAEMIVSVPFSPIAYSQTITSFRAGFAGRSLEAQETLDRLLRRLYESSLELFDGGNDHSLAAWAEAVSAFHDTDYAEQGSRIEDWIVAQHYSDGSFPNMSGMPSPESAYTRGTAKIYEILALDPVRNTAIIERTFHWLRSMQYTEENSFFVPRHLQKKVQGGFRHDYFRQQAWIDSNAHFLIGTSRIFEGQKQHV